MIWYIFDTIDAQGRQVHERIPAGNIHEFIDSLKKLGYTNVMPLYRLNTVTNRTEYVKHTMYLAD